MLLFLLPLAFHIYNTGPSLLPTTSHLISSSVSLNATSAGTFSPNLHHHSPNAEGNCAFILPTLSCLKEESVFIFVLWLTSISSWAITVQRIGAQKILNE